MPRRHAKPWSEAQGTYAKPMTCVQYKRWHGTKTKTKNDTLEWWRVAQNKSGTVHVHSPKSDKAQRQKLQLAYKNTGEWYKRKVAQLIFIHPKVARQRDRNYKRHKCVVGWPSKDEPKLAQSKAGWWKRGKGGKFFIFYLTTSLHLDTNHSSVWKFKFENGTEGRHE